MNKPAATLALSACLASGCSILGAYRRPAVEVPPAFRGQAAFEQASIADLPWWEVFKDPPLKALIEEALAGNFDLRAAVSRMDQARAALAQARSALLPQLGYEGAAGRGRDSFLGSPALTGATSSSNLAALTASWEVDFWGRLRRLDESARAQYLASEEGRRAATLSLVASAAAGYFELLELDKQLEIARRTRDSFAQSLDLFNQRFAGGVVSKLEVSRGEAARASVAAAVPEIERQIQVKENALNLLLGRGPGPIARSGLLEQSFPPQIPAGLPSRLLERRPDVLQMEQMLKSAQANLASSAGEFFPRVELTGLYGGVSERLSDITKSGSRTWAAKAGMSGPLFTGGRLWGQYRQAKAFREMARLQYEQLVMGSLREVSDALVSRAKFDEAQIEQEKSVKAYAEAVRISMERYVAGKAEYFEVLEAQQQLFPAENTLAQNQLNRLLSVVQLYKALGGGWEMPAK
jgi:multidrug efflux system outer membrane protein